MKKLTIQRLGGMLPALRPTVSHPLDSLDETQRQALSEWMSVAGRVRGAAHAEAMHYVFTLHDDSTEAAVPGHKVSAALADVPQALRGLLPAASGHRPGPGRKGGKA